MNISLILTLASCVYLYFLQLQRRVPPLTSPSIEGELLHQTVEIAGRVGSEKGYWKTVYGVLQGAVLYLFKVRYCAVN